MKTASFGVITVLENESGEVSLRVASPSEGTVNVSMTPDELLLLIVELSNGLYAGRLAEARKIIEYNLEQERRKAK